jgi:hypothetical protein
VKTQSDIASKTLQHYTLCENNLFFTNVMTKLTTPLLAKYLIIKAIPKLLKPLAEKLNQLLLNRTA